jgi:hypothetical protein
MMIGTWQLLVSASDRVPTVLADYRAGGEGVNLFTADTVILYDRYLSCVLCCVLLVVDATQVLKAGES